LTDVDISDLLALLALRGELVEPQRKVKVCRDPDDDMLIEAALEGRAEWVVTGDEDLQLKEVRERALCDAAEVSRGFLSTLMRLSSSACPDGDYRGGGDRRTRVYKLAPWTADDRACHGRIARRRYCEQLVSMR